MNRNKKRIILIFLLCVILLVGALQFLLPSRNGTRILSTPSYFIAHATGEIDGFPYTNSKESLIKSLENGYHYVEVDLGMTADSIMVLVHEWDEFNEMCLGDSAVKGYIPTYEEFKRRRIYGKYTPLSVRELMEIQKEHPFTIITDKIDNPDLLDKFFSCDKSQIQVEAFSDEAYFALQKAGYIPMRALNGIDFKHYKGFLKNGIDYKWVTANSYSNWNYLRLLRFLFGVKVAVYTVNDETFFLEHLGKEIDLVYTDNWNLQNHK